MTNPCAICGGELRARYASSDHRSGEHFTVFACPKCGCGRTLPVLPPGELPRYYKNGYYNKRKFGVDAYINRSRFQNIARRQTEGKRLLDVGCGNGSLIAKCASQGWSVAGVEMAPAEHFVDEDVQSKIFIGDVREAPFAPQSFDVVTLYHVLEHLPDPRASLRKIRELLAEGGLLVIEVPNIDSIQAGMTRGKWFNLDVPRHVFHFTPRSLVRLLEDSGFKVEHMSHYSPVYCFYGFVQSLLNLVTRRNNILFDLLNGKITLLHRSQSVHASDIILTMLFFVPAVIVAIPLTLFESLIRRGGVIVMYARA